jgi:beta-galactosidase/beta-glucuronidase
MMKKNIFLLLAMSILFLSLAAANDKPMEMDLSGDWHFSLDPGNKGISQLWASKTLNDFVKLPGTTDENKKGTLNSDNKETTHLSREYTWFGKAWYQRKVVIDKTWNGKNIRLVMERTKPTQVWVDGVSAGTNTNITTAQVYDMSQFLTVGQHTLTIMVDNGKSVPDEVIGSSHAYVEHTQTNWNGIIGKLLLKAVDLCHIDDLQTYPDITSHSVKVKLNIVNKSSANKKSEISLNAEVWNTTAIRKPVSKIVKVSLKPGDNLLEFELNLGPDALLWDEFHPDMYRLSVVLNSGNKAIDETTTNFGLRKFSTDGTRFVINGHPTFLRGKHDACVFPLIAHAAMDTESWTRYFNICKSWGINHVRFHSWCPPEAAFEAADQAGIYLQPELPYWGNEDAKKTVLIEFLRKEGINLCDVCFRQ